MPGGFRGVLSFRFLFLVVSLLFTFMVVLKLRMTVSNNNGHHNTRLRSYVPELLENIRRGDITINKNSGVIGEEHSDDDGDIESNKDRIGTRFDEGDYAGDYMSIFEGENRDSEVIHGDIVKDKTIKADEFNDSGLNQILGNIAQEQMESSKEPKNDDVLGQNALSSCIEECILSMSDFSDSEKTLCTYRCQSGLRPVYQKEVITSTVATTLDPDLLGYLKRNVQREVQREKYVLKFLSSPVINSFDHGYIHNKPNLCQNSETSILFVVPSALANVAKRERMRHGNQAAFVKNPQNKAKMVFFIGQVPKSLQPSERLKLQEKIEMEWNKYGDIIQGEYEDRYSNIWNKTRAVLKWITTYCPNVEYIVRTDDDIKIHTPRVLSALFLADAENEHFVIGVKRKRAAPQRKEEAKYYISYVEYPDKFFPPFVIGGLVGLPGRTAKLLYEASKRVKPIWLDDVYFTGILTQKLNIPVLSDNDFTFAHFVSGTKRSVPKNF